MHSTVVVLFSLFCTGWSKDITLGSTEGRKVFDEIRQANPAIWRQYENVTVIAPDNELISKVVVTDMRPEKDGDVQIVDGGAGQKSVTIELKSPTVLRGYEFHIEVYSMPDTIATDAEEHLSNEDVTPAQSNESTELPNSASKDDEHTQNSDTTELPDNANSKDIKDFPALLSDGVQSDGNRPARETEENNSQTDVPEDNITSSESDEFDLESDESTSESAEAVPIEHDITTELPQVLIEDTMADVNPDSIRPARETELHTSVVAGAPTVTDSIEGEVTTEAASETPVTDATSEVNDATTTEATVTTLSHDQATFAPISYDNTKNIPDYASLNILDYIKNRESLRPSRRTEDENVETSESSVELGENNDETTPLPEETSSIKPDDDTADLVPPTIDASYNTDFADVETTANPTEGSTINNVPRAGRGIDFDSDIETQSTPIPINTDEESTTTPANVDVTTPALDEDANIDVATPAQDEDANVDVTTPALDEDANVDVTTPTLDEDQTTTAPFDDQFRNPRGASTDVEVESDVNISEESQGDESNEEVGSGEVDATQPSRNVIVVNLEEFIARDGNNKFMYAIPIVLVINSENNNYPIIKIIAENASDDRDKEFLPTLPTDESLEPSDFDYKITENDRIKGDTSGDYERSQ